MNTITMKYFRRLTFTFFTFVIGVAISPIHFYVESIALIGKFYNEGTDEFYVISFWREGRSIRKIISRSYIHVIDFEKQNF